MISFTINDPPVPKGRPRFSIMFDRNAAMEIIREARAGDYRTVSAALRRLIRVTTHTPPETAAAEQAFRLLARKHRPQKPLTGPLRVDTVFVVTPPQKFPADRSRLWPEIRPDDDNYRKLALDSMAGEFFADDGQVCGGLSFKVYGHPARTVVRIRPLTLEDYERLAGEIGEPVAQRGIFGGEK